MCNVVISDKAAEELRDMGCNGTTFLRVGLTTGLKGRSLSACIDSCLGSTDTVVVDGDVRVVSKTHNLPFLNGLTIGFSRSLEFSI